MLIFVGYPLPLNVRELVQRYNFCQTPGKAPARMREGVCYRPGYRSGGGFLSSYYDPS